MRIKRVRIINFRCLHDIDVEFSDVTTFIGPNGVGKSTILRALDWFFNGGKSSGLSDEDATFGSTDTAMSVEVEFCDLTTEDRTVLGRYVPTSADRFTAWKHRTAEGSERMTANSKALREFSEVRGAGGAGAILQAYRALRSNQPDLRLPTAKSADEAEAAMRVYEGEHPALLVDAPADLTTDFFGFNSQATMASLFSYVLVEADLRAGEQVADTRASVIGRILEWAVDRSSADSALADLADEVQERQRQIYAESYDEQLTAISEELTRAVTQFSNDRKVAVVNEDVAMKAPRSQFHVSVIDKEVTTSVERQGHGFQRTLLVSALQLLAQRLSVGDSPGTICLAIEEPELFQHPIQAQALCKVLRSLAEDRSQSVQVTYATHSPYFLDSGHFDQIRRLSRTDQETPQQAAVVSVRQATLADVESALSGYVDADVIRRQLDAVALNRLAEALFSRAVVLVEGTTDRAIIEGVADRDGQDLLVSGVTVVDVGGRDNLLLPLAILRTLEVPTYVIFDCDGDQATRMREKGKRERDITSAVTNTSRSAGLLHSFLGAAPEGEPSTRATERFAVFEDSLESLLENEWPEWWTTREAVVAQRVGDPAKNALLYRTVTLQAPGPVPSTLTDVLNAIRRMASES